MIKATKRTMIIILTALIIVWCVYIGFKLFYRFSGKTDSYSFVPNANTELTIKSGVSDIFISNSSKDEIVVKSERAGGLEVSEDGNIITIEQKDRSFMKAGYLSVEIPARLAKLIVTTNVGDIDIASINANEAIINTSTGNIDITNVSSDTLDVKSNVGDLDISNSTPSNLTINTTTGDISIENVDSESINASLSTGDFSIEGSEFKSLNASTSTGDIEVNLPSENAKISYQAGKLTEVYLFGTEYTERSNTLSFGNAMPELVLSSNIGDIEVENN